MPGQIYALQDERIDQVCRRAYGLWTGGIVEKVLAYNPHLPEQPAVLPLGTLIKLPDPPAPKKIVSTVKLWGNTPTALTITTPPLATGQGSWLAAASERGG